MIKFKCEAKDCPNKGIEYVFLGQPESAECGGCHQMLIGFGKSDDPIIEQPPIDKVTK